MAYYEHFFDKGEKSEYYKAATQLRSEKGNQTELLKKYQRILGLLHKNFDDNRKKTGVSVCDPMHAFKLGMCAGLLDYAQLSLRQDDYFGKAAFFMERATNPKDLEYSRVLFILQSWVAPGPDLIPVEKKLRNLRPNDDAIAQCSIEVYGLSMKSEDRQYAINVAQQQIKKYPQWGALLWRYATVWKSEAYMTLNKDAARKSISLFQEYMAKFGTAEDEKAYAIYKKNLNKVIDGTFKMTGG